MEYYRSLDASTLDPDFPTVFELLASRQLADLINPYVRHILVYYAQSHPQYLIRIVNKYDELFAVLFGFVEYSHLKHWNSSFVEKFYGLKRTNRLPVSAPRARRAVESKVDPLRRLTKKQILGSVAFAVLLPYIKEKAQVRYERLQGRYAFRSVEDDRPESDAPLLKHWKYQADIAFMKWYPRLAFAEQAVDVVFTAFYLFRGSGPSSLADYILNMRYSRLSQWDSEAHELSLNRGRFKKLKQALGAVGYVLPATLFSLKFLEWWNSSEFASRLSSSGPELPPPAPGRLHDSAKATEATAFAHEHAETEVKTSAAAADGESAGESEKGSRSANTAGASQDARASNSAVPASPIKKWTGCPICSRPEPENPAVLETGVVYCYKCIWDYLNELESTAVPRCPATNIELLQTYWSVDSDQWNINGIRRLMV